MTSNWDVLNDRPTSSWPAGERSIAVSAPDLPTNLTELVVVTAATVARYTGRWTVELAISDDAGAGVGVGVVQVVLDPERPLAEQAAASRSSWATMPAAAELPTVGVRAPGSAACGPFVGIEVSAAGAVSFAPHAATAEQADRFAGHLQRIAAGVASSTPAGDLPMLGTAEVAALTAHNQRPRRDRHTLTSLIAERVEVTPDAVAVADTRGALTYAELWRRSGQLASSLQPAPLVGVWCTRDRAMVVNLLAVLRSGSAYVALEPAHPLPRLHSVATSAGLTQVLGDHPAVDLGLTTARAAPADRVLDTSSPNDLAYVMFTSGSTGEPKGVAVEHRSVVNLLRHMAAEPGLTAGERLLSVTTPSFDLSVPDLFLPLVSGATLVLAEPSEARDGTALAARIAHVAPDLMQATPATWRMLLDSGWSGAPGLRVVCGGEGYEAALARRLDEHVAGVWNFYGPTETTVWSVCRRLDARVADPVPMGHPVRGTACYVLDPRGRLAPPGVRGELHIAGTGVARGYHGRPDLTAAAFVPRLVPEVDVPPGTMMYRTGDLVRAAPDGTLSFAGRADTQVKVNGFRVELGEVEAALASYPGVRQAVVTVRGEPGAARLVGHIVGDGVDPAAARAHAARRLAPFAVPAMVGLLATLPLNGNGKVDRAALPDVRPAGTRAPARAFDTLVADIVAEVLGLPDVYVDDDILELGATSLQVGRIALRLRNALALEVTPSVIFRNPDVASLAAALVRLAALDEPDVLLAIEAL